MGSKPSNAASQRSIRGRSFGGTPHSVADGVVISTEMTTQSSSSTLSSSHLSSEITIGVRRTDQGVYVMKVFATRKCEGAATSVLPLQTGWGIFAAKALGVPHQRDIISNYLVDFLNSRNVLTPFQHGFRKGLSTTTQLVSIVHTFSSVLDKSGQVDAVSETVYEMLREMRIDENGTDSLGSEHKRLTLHFGGATRTNLEIGTTGGTNFNNEQLKIIADRMEE